jgi:RNA polymerase sigma-70 factor (ECF subfamily)
VEAERETTSADDRLDIANVVGRLPPRQRLAVGCYSYAGLSLTDTATVMKCSEGTVKSTLSDARKRLRLQLEENRDA